MNSNLTVKIGDKIKTVYGDWYTVTDIFDNIVWVDGSTTVHITKIIRVISK